jgi:protein-disulfide isomerase
MTNARTAKSTREKAADLRAQARQQEARRRSMLITAAIAAVIVVVVAAIVLVRMASNDQKAKEVALNPPPANLVQGGLLVGEANAKVTIGMYEDFQCPVCKEFDAAVSTQLKAWVGAGTARVIYHPVAILDDASSTRYSSRGANAAAAVVSANPSAVQAFFDLMYANQPPENGNGLPDEQIIGYAVQAGVDKAAVESAIASQRYAGWVTAQTEDFSKQGFTGTPTVVVNGKQVGVV